MNDKILDYPGLEWLNLNPAEPMHTQVMAALMTAKEEGVITYRMPLDTRNPITVNTARVELGPDAHIPDDGAQYFFIYLQSPTGPRTPLLLQVNAVLPFFHSLQALRVAEHLGLLKLWSVIDPKVVGATVRDMLAGVLADRIDPRGIYYAVQMPDWQTVLLKEGEVEGFVFGVAVKAGPEQAQRLSYPGGIIPA